MQSSPDLIIWTDASPVLTGTGVFFSPTRSTAGHSRFFFRVDLAPDVVSAVFDPGTGVLTIIGDDQANIIVVSRDAGGPLWVNGGTVDTSLASTIGGSSGDAQVDVVTVNGTAAADTISINAVSGAVEVSGLSALVRIRHPEVANDDLIVNGLGGADTFTTGAGVISLIGVTTNQ